MNAPCYKCEERHSNCHCHCDKYLAYVEERKTASAERRADAEMVTLTNNAISRMQSRRGTIRRHR